jgi:hypothetical protein
MREEVEVLALIDRFVRSDERIRAAFLTGSRVNPAHARLAHVVDLGAGPTGMKSSPSPGSTRPSQSTNDLAC